MIFSLKYARCDGGVPECIPTHGPEATWYMINLLLHPVLSIIVLLTNNKFQKVLNYALNDQLHSHNNEI